VTEKLKQRARGISLGLYAGDLGDLRNVANRAAGWGCDIVHFDEMDGCFVAAMIGGPGLVKALDSGPLRDVHLMVDNPAHHIPAYIKAGADIIYVHAEAKGAADAIAATRDTADRPVLAGLALMPGTSVADAADLLALNPDIILVLSLDPRTGTNPDITAACTKLAELRGHYGPDCPSLAFDGGVTADTITQIAAARPDIIVSGSAVMKAENPATAFAEMQAVWQNAQQPTQFQTGQ
jgi:ribulose-phosphate 3-epimerase